MKYIDLGKIRDAHGIRGEVFFISFSKSFDWLEGLKSLRLKRKVKDENEDYQELIEDYSILKKKAHKVGYIIKLKGINNRNQAEALKGAVLELKAEDLKKKKNERYLLDLKNYSVFQGEDCLGLVKAFSSNGAQDLLVVEADKKIIEIPFVEALVKKIDDDKKEIYVELPEGFLDL